MLIRSTALFLLAGALMAQSPTEYARKALLRIASGELDTVRRELPAWLARYPNEPSLLFLQATTLSDARQAVSIYERIVGEFPNSPWADDALCRLVQYFALRRDSLRAWQLYEQFRHSYPTSDFLVYAWETLRATVGVPPTSFSKEFTPKASPYTLQVSLFRSPKLAHKEVERLRQRRLRAEIMPKIWQGTQHYAVVVGSYQSREDAEKARPTVARQCQCQPLVIERTP